MIRAILKAVVVGWIAKKFLGRDEGARRPAPRRSGNVD
jgi:hypothetical protein